MAKNYIFATGLVVLVVVGVAYGLWRNRPSSLEFPIPITVVYDRVPYAVTASSNADMVTPGSVARFRFEVRQDGRLVDLAADKIYPHVAVVSQDLSDITFYHIDRLSSPQGGIYEFDHIFSADSPYQLWFEINDNNAVDHHGKNSSYIAKIDVPVGDIAEPATQRLVASDRTYRLTLEPTAIRIGTPSEFRIVATDAASAPVPLVTDIDHFYFAARPEDSFYVLDHPDISLTKNNAITVKNLTFPTPGSYALWARVFVSGPDNEPADLIEGSFVLSVP